MSEPTRIETVMFLQRVKLFSACTAEQILRISGIGHHATFALGDTIYRANDPADRMYCVVSGAVRLRDGTESETVLSQPASFGVNEILSGRLREHNAVAARSLTVLAIDAEDLFDLLANNIEIAKALFRRLLDAPADAVQLQGRVSEAT